MSTSKQPIVAIDGPAGSGKSTVAQLVAERAGLQFISSGAMYRAVALLALRRGVIAADRARLIELAETLDISFSTAPDGSMHTSIAGEDVTEALRNPAVAQVASVIAVIPELRAHLVAKQQEYGRGGGIVMEGRDIQTVVFPHADIKIFLVASAAERARRRWKELAARGETISYAEVLAEVQERDRRDAEREVSPLTPAADAIPVNTDGRTVTQVVGLIIRLIETWRKCSDLHGEALARAAACAEGSN